MIGSILPTGSEGRGVCCWPSGVQSPPLILYSTCTSSALSESSVVEVGS